MDNNNINNNDINNENTEKATFMDRVKGFVKSHKIPTVITALVLVLAIGTGVVFGVTRHNSNIGEFPTFSSDETGSDIDVPAIEDDEDTSSDVTSTDSEYTASTVITQTSTPDKSTSSTVSIEQPSTSTPEYPTTSTTTSGSGTTTTPSTSTPSTSTPSNPTTSTPSTPSTTPSTPSDSTSSDIEYFYTTDSNGNKVKCYFVTIGNTQFVVNCDSVYGVCSKCGLNKHFLSHSDYTCKNCGKTICDEAFYRDDNQYAYICPYCNYCEQEHFDLCPICKKEKYTQCNGNSFYEDALFGNLKWKCGNTGQVCDFN